MRRPAGIRLRRGASYRAEDGWRGDVVAPMIRDLGLSLAMRTEPETIRRALSAQMGKAGPPMNGRDLHTGDFGGGLLPAMAPLASGALTIAGIAMDQLLVFGGLALVVAFASATQDIVIDAWRIESADNPEQQGLLTSTSTLGRARSSWGSTWFARRPSARTRASCA